VQGEYDFFLVHKNIDSTNYTGIIKEVLKKDARYGYVIKPKIKVYIYSLNLNKIFF
jgi:hypothetical protein